MKKLFLIFGLALMISWLPACEKNNNQSRTEKLKKQIAELSKNGAAQTDIDELKKQIAELSKNGAAQTDIDELKKQTAELSKNTIEGSVLVSCLCNTNDTGDKRLEATGENIVKTAEKVKERCKEHAKKRNVIFISVSNCERIN